MPGHDVQFVQPGRVRFDLSLGQDDAELVQHLRAAHDAAVAAVVIGIVALEMVERGAALHIADHQRRRAVGQLAAADRDRDGGRSEPAGAVSERIGGPEVLGSH